MKLIGATLISLAVLQHSSKVDSLPQYGTTIIIKLTTDSVIVFADSKSSDLEDSTKRYPPVCKIRKVGNVYITAAGMIGFHEINTIQIISNSDPSKFHSFQSYFDTLQRQLYKPVENMIVNFGHKVPNEFVKRMGRPCLYLCFINFDRGVPKVRILEYVYTLKGNDLTIATNIREVLPGITVMGEQQAINQKYSSKLLPPTLTIPELKNLILLQTTQTPRLVGPPINILEITKHGYRWTERHQPCNW